jgi:ribosome-binding protein aMBF1 (putative translation factor)
MDSMKSVVLAVCLIMSAFSVTATTDPFSGLSEDKVESNFEQDMEERLKNDEKEDNQSQLKKEIRQEVNERVEKERNERNYSKNPLAGFLKLFV